MFERDPHVSVQASRAVKQHSGQQTHHCSLTNAHTHITEALQKNEDVYKLTAEMRNYVTWCPCTLSGLRNLVKIGEVLTRCSAYLDLAQVSPCWVQLMLKLLASRLPRGMHFWDRNCESGASGLQGSRNRSV